MTNIKITTNYHWHNFLYGYELPDNQRQEFDWMSDEEYATASFISYRGVFYALPEFVGMPEIPQWWTEGKPELKHWHGIYADSYFSAVVVRVSDDMEQYQVGLALS